MIINKNAWKSKSWNKYIRKTHDKFFFVVYKEQIIEIERRLGRELLWTCLDSRDIIPESIKEISIVICFDNQYFAEIKKTEDNLKIMQNKFDKNFSFERDGLITQSQTFGEYNEIN